jgi:DNA-binding transcriptional ArsR family regulator
MLEDFVHDVSAPPELAVELRTGPAFELLIGLSTLTGRRADTDSWVPELETCSRELKAAVAAVGPRSGELWLHLLGLALERPTDAAAAFVAAVADVDPLELRRHALGLYVPSWRQIAGAETIERAAGGDADAAKALAANDRYYAGKAADALSLLLPLSAAQTRRRVIDVLQHFHQEVFAPVEGRLLAELAADVDAKRALAASVAPSVLIAAAARGFRYVPEPEASRVILVPHLAARPWLLLCQHRDMRIICYAAPGARERDAVDEELLALGRALGDRARIRILRRLAEGEASLTELAELTGLVKSTAHHHLAQLRAAGLVTVGGNARAYRYALAADAGDEISMLLARFLGAGDS